ncbi:recombinase family protein [Paraburkholderia sediminicola]|nr:recombinase family protein [Paraburkholderia sediminicola]
MLLPEPGGVKIISRPCGVRLVLVVRWLDRISRRYDELHRTMRWLMEMGVRVECFDGSATDLIVKATRDAGLAFMAAQGEADYRNRVEMQRRGVAIAKAAGKYTGRPRANDYAAIRAWRAEHGARIRQTAEQFGVGIATVKRACAEQD